MNPEQLDQNSIDSLFGTEADRNVGMPLDYSARRSLTPDQMDTLTDLNKPIMQTLSFQLSAWLDANISLSMVSVERVLYQTFLSAQDLNALYLTRGVFASLRAPALLCIDLTCVDAVAHYGLGGSLEYTRIDATRAATPSDMALLDSLLTKVWVEVNQIWAACEIHGEFEERVLPTSTGKVFTASDNLLVFTYVLTIAEVEASLQLCLPSTIADRLLKEIHRQDTRHNQPPEVRELVLQRLRQMRHKATLRLPSFPMRFSELTALRPGDVLNTGIASSTLAEFSVHGGTVWQSRPSKFEGGHLAAQIVSPQLDS